MKQQARGELVGCDWLQNICLVNIDTYTKHCKKHLLFSFTCIFYFMLAAAYSRLTLLVLVVPVGFVWILIKVNNDRLSALLLVGQEN